MAWNEPGPGRDPWNQGGGGNRRGDGPPDLDELLKRLKARLSGSGGRGGAGAGLPKGLISLVVVLVLGLWMLTGFYVVDEQERGVELLFGEYQSTKDPGLRWHWPRPIGSVEVVNVTSVRQINDRATMLTRDENIVDIELTVQYRVSSPEDFLFNVADPEMTLQQATKAAVRETVGQSDMDFILTAGRDVIADTTKQRLQASLDLYKTGIVVNEVNLQQAQPPQEVQAAFADAIKAREDQQRLINEAEAYANSRLPQARGQAARTVEQATAYRDQVVARSEGDASRFDQLLTEYHKAPQVTRERLYLDAMSDVLDSTKKVVVDVDKGSPMFYLPLDKLGQGASKQDLYDDLPSSSGSSSSTISSSPSLSSDSSRSRDRGRQ